jgi:hypothetical protein
VSRFKAILIFAIIMISVPVIQADSANYIREKILETKAGEAPLFFTIWLASPLGYPNPFCGSYGSKIPAMQLFKADNSGNMAIWKKEKSSIIFSNIGSNKLFYFNVDSLTGRIQRSAIGPQDEYYVQLKYENSASIMKKFIRVNDQYVPDNSFSEKLIHPWHSGFWISPGGNIYIRSGRLDAPQIDKYDSDGNYIGQSGAINETKNGINIYVEKCEKDQPLVGFSTRNDSLIMRTNIWFSNSIGDWICTNDDKLYVCYEYQEHSKIYGYNKKHNLSLPEHTLILYKPIIFIVDLKDETVDKIETAKECPSEYYDFFRVSNVSLKYNGDIYASVIYFNEPGELCGDELIVFYRWRKAGDS